MTIKLALKPVKNQPWHILRSSMEMEMTKKDPQRQSKAVPLGLEGPFL